jgi:subtilisin family serine protease
MLWRKVLLILAPLVLSMGGVAFTLEFNSTSANYALDLAGKPLSNDVEIEAELLEVLAQEGAADFVVILAERPDLSKADEIQDWSERGWYVYNTLLEVATRTQAPIITYAQENGFKYRSYLSNNMVYLESGDMEAVQSLAQLPGVLQIRQPQVAQTQPTLVSDPAVPDTYGWNLDTLDPNSGLFGMQAAQVWQQYGITGQGIVVANIDTGAFYQHVALDRQYRGNQTGDIGGPYDHDYSWYQPNFIPCGNGTYPCDADFYGHGTGTIGIMTGETPDMSKQLGVAPGAKWIACMGCDDPPYCTEQALVGCADWMLAPCAIGDDPGNPSCDPDKRPQIVNNSWGGGGCSTWYQPSVQAWAASGIFPAFAAGNAGGCGTVASPGDLPDSFGVAAHFTNGANAYAGGPSCFFPTPPCDIDAHDIDPHVNAPTGGETAANEQATYSALGGTSGASPHVAGTVALIWAANPGLIGQIDATYTILEQSADRTLPAPNCGKPACAGTNDYPNYDFGWGYLDALAAVQMAGAGALGTLQGTVVEAVPLDAPGDPLADVTITAQRPGSIYPLSGMTDPSGVYTLTLSAGTYTVTADGPQHGPATISGVEVPSHTVTTLDFQLLPKGLLYGYVTDVETGAPLAATVGTAEADPVETDPLTGYYSIYLGQGSQEVLVEANNYASQTMIIDIVSGQQTRQDFALIASLALAPRPIQASVELFGSLDLTTVITNRTSLDYDYRLSHDAARAGDEGQILLVHDETLDENPDAFAIAFANLGYDYVLIDGADFFTTTIPDLLTYAAVVYTGVPAAGTEQDHIIAYLDAGGRFLLADGSFTLYHGDSRLHEVYLQALYDGLWEWTGPQTGLDIMAGLYPDISSAVVVYDSYTGPEGVGIFQVPGSHFSGIRTERAGYRSIFLSFDLNRIGARDPGDAVETDVVYRAMLWLLGYPVDDPWYSTSVQTGTIPAQSSGSFLSQFTATPAGGIDQPGEFYAQLHVEPQDMGEIYPRLDVPVHLMVIPASTMGKVAGVVTSDRPGGPMATDLLVERADGASWTTQSDWWTGSYGYWLESGTYTLTIAEAGYYSQTAQMTVTAGVTATHDFFLTMAAPEISFAPSTLDESLTFGETTTRTLLVANYGPEPLNLEVKERDRGMAPIDGWPLEASSVALDGAHILFDEYHGGNPTYYNRGFSRCGVRL